MTDYTFILIGYDIRDASGLHHLLIRNSWNDPTHYWMDFYEWHDLGCGPSDAWNYTGALPPVEADPTVSTNPAAEMCDPDHDGAVGMIESGYWCDRNKGGPLHCEHQDNCVEDDNPLQWDSDCNGMGDACDPTNYHSDPDYDDVFSNDNCPCHFNPDQHDLDGDGFGDACDDDRDDDGYANGYDCDPLNPLVALDMDQDGFCDGYNFSCDDPDFSDKSCAELCTEHCTAIASAYGSGTYQPCVDKCNHLDNCIDLSDDSCRIWIQCAMNGSGCEPDARLCQAAYANPGHPEQPDLDGDGVGDQCENYPIVNNIKIKETQTAWSKFGGGGTPQGLMYLRGELYEISFQATGGDVYYNNQGQVAYSEERRTGVRVGACYCDAHTADGEWRPLCNQPNICNKSGELNSDTLFMAWNPINAHECNDYYLHFSAPHRTEITNNRLCHEREVSFSRDHDNNEHLFSWPWKDSVRYEDFNQVVGDRFDASGHPGRTTQVRVAWPDFGNPITYFPPDQEVSYSNNISIDETKMFHVDPYLSAEHYEIHIRESLRRLSHQQIDFASAGYLFSEDAAQQTFHVHRLGARAPTVNRVWQLDTMTLVPQVPKSGSSGPLEGTLVGLAAGQKQTVFIYQEPIQIVAASGDDDAPPDARNGSLHIGVEDAGPFMETMTASDLFGVAAPNLFDTQLLYSPRLQTVFLFGRPDPQQETIEIWKLDLVEANWRGPKRLDLSRVTTGYSLAHDPIREKIYLFGGTTVGAAPSAEVHVIDPMTGATTRFQTREPAPDGLARTHGSVYLEPNQNTLYVFGGENDGTSLTDSWKLDLSTHQWELLSGPTGPDPGERPVLYFDRSSKNLWIGAFAGKSTAEPVSLWALDRDTVWHETQTSLFKTGHTWPIEDVYVAGGANVYAWTADAQTAFPGEMLVASLASAAQSLGFRIRSPWGDKMVESEPGGTNVMQAGFICPPGQSCPIEVYARQDAGSGEWISFTLQVKPAVLSLKNVHRLRGQIADMELSKDTLFVASTRGITALEAQTALLEKDTLWGFGATGITGLAKCGAHLCASRLGLYGLEVIDISDPENMSITGKTFTAGLGWDVAASGNKAYVAHGIFGVGVYDLSQPHAPAWQEQIHPPGRIVGVAANRSILVAARKNGTIYLYDIADGAQLLGEINARGRLSRVAFVAGHLWVLGQKGDWVDVFDLSDPGSPVELGGFTQNAAAHFRARFKGMHAFSFDRKKVRVYGFEPLD